MFEQALQLANKHGIAADFRNQAIEIVESACDGWGHYDSLRATFEMAYTLDRRF